MASLMTACRKSAIMKLRKRLSGGGVMYDEGLKSDIYSKAHDLEAVIVRTCSVERWKEEPIQQEEFWPQTIWPWARNVIVLGIPLFLPMAASAPSMVYQELYDTSNRIMDDMAYLLAKYITVEKKYRAIFFPRDCYYNIEVLVKNPNAAFSHVIAGYYAGVGTIGDSHNLLTKEFGPRVRIVSIITDAPIEPDPMLREELCIHCKKCLSLCPAQCFTPREGEIYDMDKVKCTEYHVRLKDEHHWPCGYCATLCPVGDDWNDYKGIGITSEGIEHCRNFGS